MAVLGTGPGDSESESADPRARRAAPTSTGVTRTASLRDWQLGVLRVGVPGPADSESELVHTN